MPNTIVVRPPFRRRGQAWLPLSRSSTRRAVTGSGGVVLGGTAGLRLSTPSVNSAVTVEWDFDNDGDFSESVEDITPYVLSMESFIGRNFPSRLHGKSVPGKLRLTLDNSDDRFSDASSPLSTAPFSLKTGRKIRLRTAEAALADPALLVKDRFNRANGPLGTTDTGEAWTGPLSSDFEIAGNQAVTEMEGAEHMAIVDAGAADYYVQARVTQFGENTTNVPPNEISLIYRYVDTANYSALFVDLDANNSGQADLQFVDVVAGVPTIIEAAGPIEMVDGMNLGVLVTGAVVRAYADGIFQMDATAINTTATRVGFDALWAGGQPAPSFDDFLVWSGRVTEVDGILFTGDVVDVVPSVVPGPEKIVTLTTEGRLARLADQDINLPTTDFARSPGLHLGQVLTLAGVNDIIGPPNSLSSSITLGPVHFPEGNALDIAQTLEEHELGFLHELPEGLIAFEHRHARDTATSQVTFSDAPGSQFGYHQITPFDSRKDLINRVRAGVANGHVGLVTGTHVSRGTAEGVSNPVSITIPPEIQNHDLLLVLIASTVRSPTEDWLEPLWWVLERDKRHNTGLRIYTHISDGTDGGEEVTFFADSDDSGGSWIAHYYRFHQWYGTHEGIHVEEPVKDNSPRATIPPWGAKPTYFVACRFGSSTGLDIDIVNPTYPLGYLNGDANIEGGVSSNSFDVALQVATRFATTPVEDPGNFTGFVGSGLRESAVIAVRGFAGANPPPDEGQLFIQLDDEDSQMEHNVIATAPTTPSFFLTEASAEAYANEVLDRHATTRPIVSIAFYANKGAHYRNQALRRRLSDKITLVADNQAGLGIDGDFFIESITHRFSHGTKLWEVTWELSPA